jgi:hypothetical protein
VLPFRFGFRVFMDMHTVTRRLSVSCAFSCAASHRTYGTGTKDIHNVHECWKHKYIRTLVHTLHVLTFIRTHVQYLNTNDHSLHTYIGPCNEHVHTIHKYSHITRNLNVNVYNVIRTYVFLRTILQPALQCGTWVDAVLGQMRCMVTCCNT